MPSRRPQKPAVPPGKLLERIERHFELLDQKLYELEARLPELSREDDESPAPASPRRRRPRKPR